MGKDSLIKSTSKKKSTAKKEAEEKKAKRAKKTSPKPTAKGTQKAEAPKATATTKSKSTPRKKAASKTKPAAKKTAAAQRRATAKKMTAAKSKAASKAKKAVVKPKKKKPTIPELLAKKFDMWKPDSLFQVADSSKKKPLPSAPPIISTANPDDAARLKALLLKKFDYETLVKAAAEKAAAEKAAAEKEASTSYQPPVETKPSDPTEKMMKYGIAGFVLLILLVIGSSYMNAGNFYIKPVDGATEIWQGKFAPKGSRMLISLPGVVYTEPVKAIYTKDDVFPLIFNYYIEKADTLLDVPGLPDFEGVKSYLEQALAYSSTAELTAIASSRINNIDLLVLQYKADVAASKDTIEGLESSLRYLKEASDFDMDQLQKRRVDRKISDVSARLKALEAQAAAEKEATEKAAAQKKEAENPDSSKEEQKAH
jgi:hypothetical protein